MTDISRCVVGGCEYNPDSWIHIQQPEQNDTIKFYDFPARASKPGDRFQRVRWIEFVRISKGQDPKSPTSWTPSKTDKICSSHFLRNCKSENPSKANFSPSIYPKCLRNLPPQITYDLRDLACWWIKEGEQKFPTLLPIVETYPPDPLQSGTKKDKPKRELKTFTLVEIDVTSEPHPFVKTYIRVNPDLSFTSCLRNSQVPAHSLLGESETTHIIGSVYEFQCILERLSQLNLCVGISTAGLNGNFPPNMDGKVMKLLMNGKETERLVSNNCEIVAKIKVCEECKKLWNKAQKYAQDKIRKRTRKPEAEKLPELSVEEKLRDCERIIENYKVEVCKLMGKNRELREKLSAGGGGGRKKRKKLGVDGGEGGGGECKKVKSSSMDDDVLEVDTQLQTPIQEVYSPLSVTSACPSPLPSRPTTPVPPQIQAPPIKKPEQIQAPITQPIRPTTPQTTVNLNPQKQNPITPQIKPSTPQPPVLKGQPANPNPPRKVIKITKEQALLLRKATQNSSGNVIRVQASQLESINKILGRRVVPTLQTSKIPTVQTESASSPTLVSRKVPDDKAEAKVPDEAPVKKVIVTVIQK